MNFGLQSAVFETVQNQGREEGVDWWRRSFWQFLSEEEDEEEEEEEEEEGK